jgi:hypothetical protein
MRSSFLGSIDVTQLRTVEAYSIILIVIIIIIIILLNLKKRCLEKQGLLGSYEYSEGP